MDSDAFARKLHHALHRECFAYWRAKAPDGRLPSRADLDPVDIPHLLPWLHLIDVARDSDGKVRFRHRLIGTGITNRVGRDVTGKWFEEVYDQTWLTRIEGDFRATVESREPQLRHCNSAVAGRQYVTYDRLCLPLAKDGKTVDMLLLCLAFSNQPTQAGRSMRHGYDARL